MDTATVGRELQQPWIYPTFFLRDLECKEKITGVRIGPISVWMKGLVSNQLYATSSTSVLSSLK